MYDLYYGQTIKARRPMQPRNVGSPFGRNAGDKAGPLPVTNEGNTYTKKIKGYDDGLHDKLLSVHEMLHYKIDSHLDRLKKNNSDTVDVFDRDN